MAMAHVYKYSLLIIIEHQNASHNSVVNPSKSRSNIISKSYLEGNIDSLLTSPIETEHAHETIASNVTMHLFRVWSIPEKTRVNAAI